MRKGAGSPASSYRRWWKAEGSSLRTSQSAVGGGDGGSSH